MSRNIARPYGLKPADITGAGLTPATGPVDMRQVLQVGTVLDTAETTAHHYFGADPASGWIVNRYDTNGIRTKATVANNGGTADYATAWTNRLSLTYS